MKLKIIIYQYIIIVFFLRMSLELTDKNIFSLWRKVSNADTQDVSLSIQQRLSSFYAIKLMLIQRFLQGCSRLRHNRHLQTYILRRLIANMPAALYRYALVLLSTEQCAAAMTGQPSCGA